MFCCYIWVKVLVAFNNISPLLSALILLKLPLFSTICLINLFPHVDVFWCLYSRQLFKTLWPKGEIAHDEQFLLLPQCFEVSLIIILALLGFFHNCAKILSKSSAENWLFVWKGQIPTYFTTLCRRRLCKISRQKII